MERVFWSNPPSHYQNNCVGYARLCYIYNAYYLYLYFCTSNINMFYNISTLTIDVWSSSYYSEIPHSIAHCPHLIIPFQVQPAVRGAWCWGGAGQRGWPGPGDGVHLQLGLRITLHTKRWAVRMTFYFSTETEMSSQVAVFPNWNYNWTFRFCLDIDFHISSLQ